MESLGLTKNQSLVYLSLLTLGSTSIQPLIKETGLHRSRVYDALEKLEELGLMSSVVKDYKKYFQASQPEKLLEYLEEKKAMVQSILPQLKKLESMKKEEMHASLYKGIEGLKTIHSEMLNSSKEVYVLGAKGLIFQVLKYFTPRFERERTRKKIKFFLIYDNKDIKKYERGVVKRRLFEGKILPRGFNSHAVVNIFGNKVAIVHWKEKYPTTFVIENSEVADAFRKWFRFMYMKL